MNVARLKHVCFLLRSVVFASGNSYWRPSFRVADSRARDVASVMQNSPEVRSCSVNKLDEEVCYTKHGGVVISLGWNTPLYWHIMKNIPGAHAIIVDVSKIIPAPLKRHRVKKAFFPDERVVTQVQESPEFEEALRRCECVLDNYGIVLVTCKGGNHRAPTIADSMKRPGRIIIHATLGKREAICPQHIEVLVHACVQSSSTENFYKQLTKDLVGKKYITRLCAGWQAGDLASGKSDTSNQFPKAGVDVEVQSVSGCWCTVKEKDSEGTFTLPITWFVPTCVYKRRESV